MFPSQRGDRSRRRPTPESAHPPPAQADASHGNDATSPIGEIPHDPAVLDRLQAEIGKALARDRDLRKTLQVCAEIIGRHAEVALTRIWVFQGGLMKLQASAGLLVHQDDARSQVPVGQFSIGHVARTRQGVVTNSILDHPHIHDKEWARREGLTAFAGCPLLADNELEGILAVFGNKPIPAPVFDVLTTLARDLGLTIKRHRVDEVCDTLADPHAAGLRAEHAIIVTNRDGTIADWNNGAEECFGYRREEALGQPLDILAPPDRADEQRDIMIRVARGEQVCRPETVRQNKAGRSIDVRLTVSGLRDAAGVLIGAITVAHDLAEFKMLQQQFCLAQKMEVFGQLAGGVAHDFNNLLTVILGYSELGLGRLSANDIVATSETVVTSCQLVEDSGADQPAASRHEKPANDSMRELLREIQKAGQRAESLTRQLLAFSRKKLLEPKVLDLNAVVRDTEKMLRRLIGEDILMTTHLAPSLKLVKIDPGHLQQVILNLAVNARDAMPKGGRLTIKTANISIAEAGTSEVLETEVVAQSPERATASTSDVSTAHLAPGAYVLFALSDTGVGMNAATKARIFEPLFTTKGPGKGTGLGLATVASIVKQYGGHIEVSSQPGRGSTFRVYLPQVQESLCLNKSNSLLPTIKRGNETVLLVEDDPAVRSVAKHVLELNGYNVLVAMDGEEAVCIVESHDGPIHLLLADVVLPQLSGRLLAERLLALRPQLKVLFLSGYTNEAIDRHGVLESDFAFLQKPFSASALAQKVRDVLDSPVQDAS